MTGAKPGAPPPEPPGAPPGYRSGSEGGRAKEPSDADADGVRAFAAGETAALEVHDLDQEDLAQEAQDLEEGGRGA